MVGSMDGPRLSMARPLKSNRILNMMGKKNKETQTEAVPLEPIVPGTVVIAFVQGGKAEIFDLVGPSPLSIDVDLARQDKGYARICMEGILLCGLSDPKKIEAMQHLIKELNKHE